MQNNRSYFSEVKNLAKILYNLDPLELTAIGCILGLVMSEGLDFNEQNTIGNFLELVGQVILTYNAQQETVEANSNLSISELESQIEYLHNEVMRLKRLTQNKKGN